MAPRILRFVAALALALTTSVVAQDYPSKPIVMVVPFAAGGPTDTLGRNLAEGMTRALKRQVIIDNTVGAGGTIGANKVAKAKPDGYMVLLHHIGMATAPGLYRSLPFNPLNDYEFVGQVADVPMTLLAKKTLPPNNFKEFVAYLKQNKSKMTYGK